MGNKGIGANNTVVSDHRIAAQHRSTCVDRNIILNGGMAALASQALPATGRERTQSHTLIDLHVVTDHRGLTHDDTGTVVNEEKLTHSGAGMDIDAGNAMGVLCHNSGNHGLSAGPCTVYP